MYRIKYLMALFATIGVFLSACASYEKRVELTYDPAFRFAGGDGEVYVVGPVIEARLMRLPGGRVVLGRVQDSVTQIVTADDVSKWIERAFVEELQHAGFRVRAPSLPPGEKGILIRVVSLSSNQYSDGLILNTYTQIGLSVDVWKRGGLVKTITASAGSQEKGIDRSGAAVSTSLGDTLKSALEQLVPDIIKNLQS